MGRFVVGAERDQTTLFPPCLEDWIAEDNPVRVVDAFMDALDLGACPTSAPVGQIEGLHERRMAGSS